MVQSLGFGEAGSGDIQGDIQSNHSTAADDTYPAWPYVPERKEFVNTHVSAY